MKRHKGQIENWFRQEVGNKTVILGRFVNHPEFGYANGRTSYIVSHDEATGEIETRNSRYTLVGKELQ